MSHFAIGLIIYAASVTLTYLPSWKQSQWFIPVGALLGLLANVVWSHLAKNTAEPQALYVNGLIWDSIIVLCYAAIPVLFFGVRLGIVNSIGAILVIIGLILTKI